MQIDSTTAAGLTTDTTRTPSPTLDKDGFLKLMLEQLKQQDPSNAQDSSQMLQQMSQLTSMEQLTNMSTALSTQIDEQKAMRSEALIGRSVSYLGEDGTTVTSGTVEKVTLADGKPLLTISGASGVDPDRLTEVR